jgi:hypothetical protein
MIKFTPGCPCCVTPCNRAVSVVVEKCNGTADSGRTVEFYDGATLLGSCTTNGSGACSYTLAGTIPEGTVITVKAYGTDYTISKTVVFSCAGTSVIFETKTCDECFASWPASITLTTPRGTVTLTGGSTGSGNYGWSGTEAVYTTSGRPRKNWGSPSFACGPNCSALAVTDGDVTVTYQFGCSSTSGQVVLIATWLEGVCPPETLCTGLPLLDGGCTPSGTPPDGSSTTTCTDVDSIELCAEYDCDATSVVFTLDLSPVTGSGTYTVDQ